MIEDVTLADGTPAWVVPLQRADKERLAEEFQKLSPESRRRRFLTPVTHLSEQMLGHLVDDVDWIDHVAFVLCVGAEHEPEPIAIARCVRYPSVPDAADLAVTVHDAWQGRGVASAAAGGDALPPRGRDAPAHRGQHRQPRVAGDVGAAGAGHHARHRLRRVRRRRGPQRIRRPADVDLTSDRIHPVLREAERAMFRTRDAVCPWLN